MEGTGSEGWNVDVEAVEVGIDPSVEWGVEIPEDSPVRRVEQVEVTLGFRPDRVVLSNGKMDWLGSRFEVDGTIFKKEKKPGAEEPARKQKTLLPVFITKQQFQTLENRMGMLSLPNGATIKIDFEVDTANYSASWVDLAVGAKDVAFKGLGFSKLEIVGSYTYPAIHLEHAALFQGKHSVRLVGDYSLASKEVAGSLYNSITSNQPLQLLPDRIQGSIAKAGLRIDALPRLELDFGPSVARELPNHLSGTFSIRNVGYQGLEFEALRGKVKRENNRLEFTELQASVLGQEERAEEMGSAMRGGSAEGSVFWDGNKREFGVDVDASLDPNILVQALSPIGIATNIIRRFRFKDRPPSGHVAVGAELDDLDTFHIDIQALGSEVSIQGVEFTSVNITQTYKHGKLNLDPIAAKQGSDFLKGAMLLDIRESTASFDIVSSMAPTDLEDLVCPGLRLFGNHIAADGKIDIAAHGVFDWGSMEKTDFSAKVEVERLGIPIAELDSFSAKVVGDGPVIALEDARFGLYGGEGDAKFSVVWNPAEETLPYLANFSFSGVDFREFLEFFDGERPVAVSGKMDGSMRFEADLTTNFFAAAKGSGFVRVEKGQLTDLPLFNGFSRLMRKMLPSFTLFSITSLRGNFTIDDGVVSSEDAYFGGDVISAKGKGSYRPSSGFDALVQVQMLSDGRISKVVRVITDPLMKLFEMRLTGTLAKPSWKLEKF